MNERIPEQNWSQEQLTEMYGDNTIGKLAFLAGCHKRKLINDPDGDGWIIDDSVLEKFAELIKLAIYDLVKDELIDDALINEEPDQLVRQYLKGGNGSIVDVLCRIKMFGLEGEE